MPGIQIIFAESPSKESFFKIFDSASRVIFLVLPSYKVFRGGSSYKQAKKDFAIVFDFVNFFAKFKLLQAKMFLGETENFAKLF